jgi:uncharacterized membrane protein YtjA (UPF0391 family)
MYWAMLFLVVALVAAVFGFGGFITGAVLVARTLFWIFLGLFVIAVVVSLVRRRRRRNLP